MLRKQSYLHTIWFIRLPYFKFKFNSVMFNFLFQKRFYFFGNKLKLLFYGFTIKFWFFYNILLEFKNYM